MYVLRFQKGRLIGIYLKRLCDGMPFNNTDPDRCKISVEKKNVTGITVPSGTEHRRA
jgi:hypothetical protein